MTMKNARRIAGLVLALALVLVMMIPAFAATELNLKGSITIQDNDTVKASEKNFSAYKILDLKVYGNAETNEIETYSYAVPADLADFYATYFNLDKTASDFEIKVVAAIDQKNKDGELYDFAKAAIEAAVAADNAPFNGKVIEGGFQFTGLPLGYYVIDDTTNPDVTSYKPVSALILDTATPDVKIEVKAEKPPVDKKIDNDNDVNTTDDRVDANEAAIGDTITYVIDSKVPEMTGYDKYFFIFEDTMSKGLTYTNTMRVTVGTKVLAEGADYTVTVTENEDGTTGLKIVLNNFIQYNTAEFVDAKVEASYTARLNEDAEVNEIPNTNEVYLKYSNNPDVIYGGENEPTPEEEQREPLGETPKEKVETYTTTLEIVKTDPTGNRLQGAEFTLTGSTMNTVRVEVESFELDPAGEYWKLTNGSYTTTAPGSIIDNVEVKADQYESTTDKYTKTTTVEYKTQEGEELTITGTVGEDGVLRFEGIPSGTYVIKEIKAPEGYNILTETIEVVITATYEEVDGEGVINYTYEGAADNNGVARVTVVNQMGSELPSTGGTGTTIFYIVGAVLALAAVVLLVTRKRMSANA